MMANSRDSLVIEKWFVMRVIYEKHFLVLITGLNNICLVGWGGCGEVLEAFLTMTHVCYSFQ